MNQFYTQTGDDGFTNLLGEGRVEKYDPRMEALGDLDEASACLGLARSICQAPGLPVLLLALQRDIYQIMAEVAATPENAQRFRSINAEKITWLEGHIAEITAQVVIPAEFIVPGDTHSSAALALARTVVRRAERRIAQLHHSGHITNHALLRYMNRLSSLCFACEILENHAIKAGPPTLAKI